MFVVSVSQTACLLYHIHFCLSRTFFKFLKQVFQNSFWSDASLIEATRISYHKVFCLSTIIFAFFKTFWIVCSLETISCDSSIRIPLSPSPVNTLFYFSLKYSGFPHGRRVCPIKSEDCGRLLVGYMRDAGDWYRTTNVANSAGFLIRCRYLLSFVVHIFFPADSSMLYVSCHSFLLLTPLPLLPSTPKRSQLAPLRCRITRFACFLRLRR